MKIRMRCREDKEGKVSHIWKCTCPVFYWETEEAKSDPNYQLYLSWKNKQGVQE